MSRARNKARGFFCLFSLLVESVNTFANAHLRQIAGIPKIFVFRFALEKILGDPPPAIWVLTDSTAFKAATRRIGKKCDPLQTLNLTKGQDNDQNRYISKCYRRNHRGS